VSPGSRTETTLVSSLAERLRACRLTSQGIAPPAAILWTDPGREWTPILGDLRAELPELLTLGDFDPESRTGPAIWLRCVVDGALEPDGWPKGQTPIVYLPGVARQHLRAGQECPRAFQPLVELMFRGTLWLQRNGYDWTLTALLTSTNGGLGLDLGRDDETLRALPRALPEVARTPIAHLEGRKLTAESFDRLLTDDPVRDLLRWMSDPKAWHGKPDENRWQALRNQWRDQFAFDPETDGDLVAGQRMGKGEGAWSRVWDRFEEAPTAYPGVPALLRRSRPTDLFVDRSRWPDENETSEAELRTALERVVEMPHPEACAAILKLEEVHGERRDWVWSRLGAAPLAVVIEALAEVATNASSALGGATPDEAATLYAEGAWRADAAAWRALALAPTPEEELVGRVVRALLLPWQDASARAFQRCFEQGGALTSEPEPPVEVPEGGCLVFADGLRFDLGQALAERLEASGCEVQIGHRWAALPSVTATAKPAVTPVADRIEGAEMPDDFAPRLRKGGRPVIASRLRSELKEVGYQVLGGELGDWPATPDARGWSEEGQIDSLGHKLHARLASQLEGELERLATRILALLDGGWRSVRVVTDHGWLLLPGGLPKVDLPRHLTESRWSRCAKISGASEPNVPTAPWHWNPEARFATAPGIACFNASPEYAHGGISIQECLIPDLVVERAGGSVIRASIERVTWRGMRCVVDARASGAGAGLEGIRVDLRLGGAMGPRVAVDAKELDADGRASLVVGDDEHEGAAATVVLLGPDDTILAQQNTSVGEPT
jgi:hypothetical protein